MSLASTGRFDARLRRLIDESYDTCRSCDAALPEGTASYAGYDLDGNALYVGHCCRDRLAELATHVYWWQHKDKRCPPETVLWRFMDLPKFIYLLEHRALYFPRADTLGDPFEGAAGLVSRRERWNDHYLAFFRNAVRSIPGRTSKPSSEHVEAEAARLLRDIQRHGEQLRLCAFVSCWHANNVESEALWRLYCPPQTAGVAIRTSAGTLRDSLGDRADIKIARVLYADFRTHYAELNDRLFWKRTSLAHESEVRAVINRHRPQQELGVAAPVNLDLLIKAVVPSPFAPPWFPELLGAMMRRYEASPPVEESELLSQPFF